MPMWLFNSKTSSKSIKSHKGYKYFLEYNFDIWRIKLINYYRYQHFSNLVGMIVVKEVDNNMKYNINKTNIQEIKRVHFGCCPFVFH